MTLCVKIRKQFGGKSLAKWKKVKKRNILSQAAAGS